MAKIQIKMPDDFMDKLSNLGEHTDEITESVLEEGAKVIEAEMRTNLEGVIGKKTKNKSKSTGQLISALGSSSVKQDKNGNFNIKIGFSEDRMDGNSNSKIANIIEYGTSKQKAKPFLKPALRKSKDECINAMVRKLDEEIDKI